MGSLKRNLELPAFLTPLSAIRYLRTCRNSICIHFRRTSRSARNPRFNSIRAICLAVAQRKYRKILPSLRKYFSASTSPYSDRNPLIPSYSELAPFQLAPPSLVSPARPRLRAQYYAMGFLAVLLGVYSAR